PSIRSRSKSIADASIHFPTADLEIGDGINVMLLLVERHKVLQWPQASVVLNPEREALTEIARQARGRYERYIAIASKPDVNDRIYDELDVVLAEANDRSDLHVPFRL